MVELILYRDHNRTGESADTASVEGAVLPQFTRIAAYESYIYRLLRLKESRGVPGTFDRDLTVIGVNVGEQPETQALGIRLEKADF